MSGPFPGAVASNRRRNDGVGPGVDTARVRYYPEVSGATPRAVLADLVVVALVALFAWLGLTVNDTFDDAAGLGRGGPGSR